MIDKVGEILMEKKQRTVLTSKYEHIYYKL